MKMTQKLVLTLVMGAWLGMPMAYAKDKIDEKAQRIVSRNSEILDQLNLTPEQRKKLDVSKETQMAQIKGLLSQMMTLNKQLNEELMKPKLDIGTLTSLNDQLKAVQGQMADKRISTIMEVRKTLTPEQFNKFITLTEEMRSKRHGAHHGGGMK